MTTEYKCSRCMVVKPSDSFYILKRKLKPPANWLLRKEIMGAACPPYREIREERDCYCKACRKLVGKEAYHDPEWRAKDRERRRVAFLERASKRQLTRRAMMTPEQRAAACVSASKWRKTHGDKYRMMDSMYKKMKRSQLYIVWKDALINHYDGCCACHSRDRLCMDHIIPLQPGADELNCLGNLQPLCMQCNARKVGRAFDYRPDSGRWLLEREPRAWEIFGSKPVAQTGLIMTVSSYEGWTSPIRDREIYIKESPTVSKGGKRSGVFGQMAKFKRPVR